MLTNTDLIELTKFRRQLHRHPELSGEEVETAHTVTSALKLMSPTKILTGLGGHGVAAIFDSGVAGPTVLFRAELDALPIEERNDIAWSSVIAGQSHTCGHDGHMTMLLALGRMITRYPVAKGRVILMFQPSEENGSGAKAVISDPKYNEIQTDWAFAIHIEPGRPFGYVATCPGLINCASLGLGIKLIGKTAHAAEPEDGISPSQAIAKLIPVLEALGPGGELNDSFQLVTITHIQIGEPSFGVAPGDGIIYTTLRAVRDEQIISIETSVRNLALTIAAEYGLEVEFFQSDIFAASVNDQDAYQIAVNAMDAIGVIHGDIGVPMKASEDFGVFGWNAKAAMLCLGPGEGYPALHNPNYDFPDDLIPIGSAIFERITRDLLGSA
jgi:amidohydrolase